MLIKINKIKTLLLFTPLLWRGAGGEVIAQTNLVPNAGFETVNSCDSIWLGPCYNQVYPRSA